MIKKHINHTFWCLNTNSGDTEGLWKNLSYSINSGTTITWDEEKYNMFEQALWQTKSGKYIGLDHKQPLGLNGTGLSLTEYYASGEESNLDSAGPTDPKPPIEPPTDPQEKPTEPTVTTKPQNPVTTVTSPVTTNKPSSLTTIVTTVKNETTTKSPTKPATEPPTNPPIDVPTEDIPDGKCYGNVDNDDNNNINVADLVALNTYLLNSEKNPLSPDGKANADVVRDNKIDPSDGSLLLNFLAEQIEKEELGKSS